MKNWLTRWDVTRAEQAGMTFGQVLTVVNVRRVQIACLLGIFTKMVEISVAFRPDLILLQMFMAFAFLLIALALRNSRNPWIARGFVAVFLVTVLLFTQWTIGAMGAQGRLTSGYPMMLLSLTLLFVLPPNILALVLTVLFASYCVIVFGTPTQPGEQVIAIQNAGIVSVISVIAAALIYSSRRRDHDQKHTIRLQNDQLIDRNNELDTLMAITAHDLRSPLFGLRNLFDLAVRRAPREPGLPVVVLGQAMASIDGMLALATRLLDAHAAEHRPLTHMVEEDVRGHVLAAIGRIKPLAQSADVRIDMDLPDRPLIAAIEAAALAQILDNLLSNGVRYSPVGSAITIGAVREGSRAAILIRDQGPGIDPAHQNALFKKFHRGTGGHAKNMPGTGMGLFIVATLAERMAATVRYEPNGGGGSTFVVSLPTRQ